MELNDENDLHQLIINTKNGDLSSFEKLYHFYYPKLYTFIDKQLQSPFDSEEITQDIFLKIWKNKDGLDINQSIDGYIFRVAKNTLIDFFRKKKVKSYTLEKTSISEVPSPENQIYHKELYQLATQAIASLPEKRKNIYLLSREEGLTYAQIAGKLGVSVKTVETQMRLALKTLREKLKQHTDETLFIALLIKLFF